MLRDSVAFLKIVFTATQKAVNYVKRQLDYLIMVFFYGFLNINFYVDDVGIVQPLDPLFGRFGQLKFNLTCLLLYFQKRNGR